MSPLDVPLAILGVAFVLALVRIGIGPTLADRVVAGEVGLVTFVAGLALLAARLGEDHLLDAVVVAALLQFIATVALARLIERRERRP